MQADSKSIHSVEVFNRRSVVFEITATVNATVAKGLDHHTQVIRIRHCHPSCDARSSTDLVEKHAHEFIGHI
jgi:hypothetical protein